MSELQPGLSLRFSGVLGPLVARLTRGLNGRYLALEAKGLSERSTSTQITASQERLRCRIR